MTGVSSPSNVSAASFERRREAAAQILLSVLGFSATLYLLVWQRALFSIFGASAAAMTVSAATFLFGFGLGAPLGGLLSKTRRISPLPALAVVSFLLGAFGHFSLDIMQASRDFALEKPLPTMALVSLSLLFVPSLLLGAIVPLLSGNAARTSPDGGLAFGRLTFAFLFGTGLACIVAGSFAFPFLQSMRAVVDLSVMLNGILSLCAILLSGFSKKERPQTVDEKTDPAGPLLGLFSMLGLSFLGGFFLPSYGVFFSRVLSCLTGSDPAGTIYALGVFLLGFAFGARNAGKREKALSVRGSFGLLLSGALALAFLPALQRLDLLGGPYKAHLLAAALFMIALIGRGWGRALPLLAHRGFAPDTSASLKTAWLLLSYTAGAVAGLVVTGFFLTNGLGLAQIALVLGLLSLGYAALLAAASASPLPAKIGYAALCVLIAAVANAFPLRTEDILGTLFAQASPGISLPLHHIVENRDGILAVDAREILYADGKPAGTFDTPSLRNPDWAKLPYELSLLSPAPREVLQIGLGSGSWVRAIANNPDIDRLTVVESDPGFLDIAALRDDIAYLSDNPSVSIVTDNARRWLELNPDKTFDVIVLNTASLRNAYASNFLSREFFDLVKWHLNPNGLFIFDTENSERAMLTGCSAFVYGLRFQNRIVVSMSPIMPNANRWKKSLSTEHIDDMPILNLKKKEDRAFFKKLDNVENADDPVFGSLIEDCSKILRRTRSLEPFSDDNMGDEWIRRYRQK